MADEEGVVNLKKITLFLSNKEVLVWDKASINKLRKDYRIVGSLVGSLPGNPRQNLISSLPLVLEYEEAKLLVDKNIATLVVSTPLKPSDAMVDTFKTERETNIEEQLQYLREMKKQKLEQFASVIEDARKEKRDKIFVEKPSKKRRLDDSVERKDNNTMITNDLTISETNEDSALIHINCSHPESLQKTTDTQLSFPNSEPEQLRYTVFCDLWDRGYFITGGSKFGGDYLVYPGDPCRFHSYFIIIVIPWDKKFTPLELISIGRLGSSTKKASVLASVDNDHNVKYSSIKWPGFT